jgi:hypothetical protein
MVAIVPAESEHRQRLYSVCRLIRLAGRRDTEAQETAIGLPYTALFCDSPSRPPHARFRPLRTIQAMATIWTNRITA